MAIGICIFAVCLLFVSGHAKKQPESIDEAIREAAGPNVMSRRMGDEVRDGMDMVLSRAQHDALYGKTKGRAAGDVYIPWTNAEIPYEIVPHFDEMRVHKIEQGMRAWEALTCIRFRESWDPAEHRVQIFSGDGCYSLLGMTTGYTQPLSLQANGCFWRGTVEHELGHAIGLVHEHQRPNRDDNLAIFMQHVNPMFHSQLTRYAPTVTKLGLGYDYHSVMHYGHYAFTVRQDLPTISAYDFSQGRYLTEVDEFIGKVLGPSYTDVKLVNLMYNCSDRCPNPPSCSPECFVDEHCNCFCEEDMPEVPCYDSSPNCASMSLSRCLTERFNMEIFCRKTCGLCAIPGTNLPRDEPDIEVPCEDYNEQCSYWASYGECHANPGFMLDNCPKSCQVC